MLSLTKHTESVWGVLVAVKKAKPKRLDLEICVCNVRQTFSRHEPRFSPAALLKEEGKKRS